MMLLSNSNMSIIFSNDMCAFELYYLMKYNTSVPGISGI